MNSLVMKFVYLFLYLFFSITAFFLIAFFIIALIGNYLHGVLLFSWSDVQDAAVYGLLASTGGTAMSVLYKVNGWKNER